MRAILMIAGLVTAAPAPALADGPTVEVDLVHATRGEPSMDPALSDVAADLKSLPYQGFRRLGGASLAAERGKSATGDLGKGVTVTVELKGIVDGAATVHVVIQRGDKAVVDTDVRRPLNRASVLGVGPFDGGTLVVPVLVKP